MKSLKGNVGVYSGKLDAGAQLIEPVASEASQQKKKEESSDLSEGKSILMAEAVARSSLKMATNKLNVKIEGDKKKKRFNHRLLPTAGQRLSYHLINDQFKLVINNKHKSQAEMLMRLFNQTF